MNSLKVILLGAIWYGASAIGLAIMLWLSVQLFGLVAREVSWLLSLL